MRENQAAPDGNAKMSSRFRLSAMNLSPALIFGQNYGTAEPGRRLRLACTYKERRASRRSDARGGMNSTMAAKPTSRSPALDEARLRQQVIGAKLRQMFDDVVREPVPDEFLDILRRVDPSDAGEG
jgi:hypothetical protein